MAVLSMYENVEVVNKENDWEELDQLFGLQRDAIDSDVAVIVLKIHEPAFVSKKRSFDYHIYGKTLTEWVCMAFANCPVFEIEADADMDILATIKPHLSDKKYTAVFFADTPLLQRRTFLGIIDYVKTKRMNVCKLERGYVFVTDYLRTAEKIYTPVNSNLEVGNDLARVYDVESFNFAQRELKKRILSFHMMHGAEILDIDSTSIDADVVIGKNVIIHPNNVLIGRTVIEDNVVLLPGNTIIDSQIAKDSKINNSVIQCSKIKENCIIEPFSYIINGEVKR